MSWADYLPADAASDPWAPWNVVLCTEDECDEEVFPQEMEEHLREVHGIELDHEP